MNNKIINLDIKDELPKKNAKYFNRFMEVATIILKDTHPDLLKRLQDAYIDNWDSFLIKLYWFPLSADYGALSDSYIKEIQCAYGHEVDKAVKVYEFIIQLFGYGIKNNDHLIFDNITTIFLNTHNHAESVRKYLSVLRNKTDFQIFVLENAPDIILDIYLEELKYHYLSKME